MRYSKRRLDSSANERSREEVIADQVHSEEPRKRNEKGKREHVQGYYKRLAVIEPPVSQRGSATFGRIPEHPQLELQHADSGFKHGSTFVESSTTLNTDIFDLFEPQPLLTVSL